MTSSELRDYATVVAATVALLVFIFNAISAGRNRRIENLCASTSRTVSCSTTEPPRRLTALTSSGPPAPASPTLQSQLPRKPARRSPTFT